MEAIPFSKAEITPEDKRAVMQVLDSRMVAMGKATEAFEAAVSLFYKKSHAVAVSSGTAGLHLALIASGLRSLFVPDYTFIATVNAAVMAVGIDNVRLVDEVPATRATPVNVPCHLFGEHSVHAVDPATSIVDACEGLGDRALSLGRAAVFSFWANKQIVSGEGGMVVTDDAELARTVRRLANHGRGVAGFCEQPGFNFRMDEMSAALGLSQFKRIGSILEKRKRIANWYIERLGNLSFCNGQAFGPVPKQRESWFIFNIQVPSNARDYIWRMLLQQGIETRKYFEFPAHKHPAYKNYLYGSKYPVADYLAARCLALPFFNEITEAQVTRVTQALGALLLEVDPESPFDSQDAVDRHHT